MWEQISNPSVTVTPGYTMLTTVTGGRWPAMGPAPWQPEYLPWATQIGGYRCPSDPGNLPGVATGRTNYAANLGDALDGVFYGGRNELGVYQDPGTNTLTVSNDHVLRAKAGNRGFFWSRHSIGFKDILDGLSNTVAAGEICTSLGARELRADWVRNINFQGTGSYGGAANRYFATKELISILHVRLFMPMPQVLIPIHRMLAVAVGPTDALLIARFKPSFHLTDLIAHSTLPTAIGTLYQPYRVATKVELMFSWATVQ